LQADRRNPPGAKGYGANRRRRKSLWFETPPMGTDPNLEGLDRTREHAVRSIAAMPDWGKQRKLWEALLQARSASRARS